MNLEIIESVIDLIEMGAVRSEDVVKNLRSAIKDTLEQSSTPPQRTWVGLTRDEQSFIYSSLHSATSRKDSFWVDFANAIEDRLKEKNT